MLLKHAPVTKRNEALSLSEDMRKMSLDCDAPSSSLSKFHQLVSDLTKYFRNASSKQGANKHLLDKCRQEYYILSVLSALFGNPNKEQILTGHAKKASLGEIRANSFKTDKQRKNTLYEVLR